MFNEIVSGFSNLFHIGTFFNLILGFLLGLLFGAIPGLTATLAIALLLPFTFGLGINNALVMVMGIYMAGIYSGSITATTINIPGAPAAAMTAIEGYPMMKRGEGAKALAHGSFGSFVGGTLGAIILIFVAPLVMKVSLLIQTPDRFSLVLLAILTVSVVHGGSITKGIISSVIGLMFKTVGMDPMVPLGRFHFGSPYLIEGVRLIPAVIGIFALSELFIQIDQKAGKEKILLMNNLGKKISRFDFIPRWSDIKQIGIITYIKSALIGLFVGVLPGGGASMASFISYAEAKRTTKYPEKYGKGFIEGIAASETANNAMCGGALIPLLTLGIPGDTVTAIIFGVLLIQGLFPGPQLFIEAGDVVFTMFAALLFSPILIMLTTFMFGPYYLKIADFNKAILFPFIGIIALAGTYISEYSIFQMWMALLMGIIAFFLRKNDYPIVPMLMGIILGGYLEEFLRRSLIISELNPIIFITRPFSLGFLLMGVIFVYFLGIRKPLSKKIELT